MPRFSLRRLILLLVLGLACGAAAAVSQGRLLDVALYDYSGAIRWSKFDVAYGFVDPAVRAEHPLSSIERDRYEQIEVTHYEVTATGGTKDTVDREVQIDLINRNTQAQRTIHYHEHWQWDAKTKHWWLTTGLPDISPSADK